MPSNYTQNYSLNQWEADDKVERADFNADNAKIDAAIAQAALGNCRVEYGSYVGTGTYGSANPTTLRLGYQPKLLIIPGGSFTVFAQGAGSFAFFGGSLNYFLVTWLEDGLQWCCSNSSTATASRQLNSAGTTYRYIAFH